MTPDDHQCMPGLRAELQLTVSQADTADAMACGDVPVLATPRILALAEQAAMAALGDCLPEDRACVGQWAEITHEHPTPIGDTVTAEAVLIGVHGRRLEFSVSLRDSSGEEVAHVRHRRVLASRERFESPIG